MHDKCHVRLLYSTGRVVWSSTRAAAALHRLLCERGGLRHVVAVPAAFAHRQRTPESSALVGEPQRHTLTQNLRFSVCHIGRRRWRIRCPFNAAALPLRAAPAGRRRLQQSFLREKRHLTAKAPAAAAPSASCTLHMWACRAWHGGAWHGARHVVLHAYGGRGAQAFGRRPSAPCRSTAWRCSSSASRGIGPVRPKCTVLQYPPDISNPVPLRAEAQRAPLPPQLHRRRADKRRICNHR